jgi:phosphoribosylanthranilate isomerase
MTAAVAPGESGPILVKICGITSEADALLAVAMGADALGFVFAPSPRQVTPKVVRNIVERVPRGIVTVGVFRNEAPRRVAEIVNEIGLRAAQLHGDESTADTRWVAERVPLTIKAFPAGHPGIGRFKAYGAQAVLVDALSPGSGEVFDWRVAEGVVDPRRLIVSGGLHAGNVGDAIAHLRPLGVDVSSGVESEPGRKDPTRVRDFVAAARAAERLLPGAAGDAGEETDDERRDRVAPGFDEGAGAPALFDWETQA